MFGYQNYDGLIKHIETCFLFSITFKNLCKNDAIYTSLESLLEKPSEPGFSFWNILNYNFNLGKDIETLRFSILCLFV